jgi:hypothetical protein
MPLPKKMSPDKNTESFKFVPASKDLPATRGMLQLVRNELKAEIKGGFNRIDAKFNQVDARFEQVLSEVARIGILVEEQNSNNRVVLEGLSGLWQRQEQFEERLVSEVERTVAAAFVRLKT